MTDVEPRLDEPCPAARNLGLERFQALQELTDALAQGSSEASFFQQALGILQATTEYSHFAILVLDPASQMRFQTSRGFSDGLIQTVEGFCPWPFELQNPQPLLAEDLLLDPSLASCGAGLLAEGVRSLACVPLLSQGRLLGEILLGSHHQRSFTPEEIRFIIAVANLAGCAAARSRQEHAMTEAVAFSERLIDTANILVVGLDHVGKVIIFNETAEHVTGYSKEELLGRNWFDTMVPQERFPFVRSYFEQLLESRTTLLEMETPLFTKEGEERLVAWRNSVFLDPGARVATLSFGIDVTEARRTLESLRASEERFSKIFHLSPDAIDLTRLEDGVSLDCNNSYVKMTGYSREEIIGHSTLPGDLGLWVHKEDRDRHIAELRAKGEIVGFEVPLRRKDGSVYIALLSSSTIEINGQPCNLDLTHDITERKHAEEALRESSQRLQLALASGNFGIWDRNLQDDTEIWDDRMYELYGVERGAITANYASWAAKIVHPEDVPGIQEALRAALAGEQPYDLKFRIVRPDGSVRHIGSNGVVIRDAAGKAVRVIGINRDRTEQVLAEAERRRLQAEVHHAEKIESIGSLAGGVAHDMNNVLTAILITAEMLGCELADDDPMAKSLAVILHAGQRGRDLVKALTDFARKGLEETTPVDLNEVLRKEVELLRHTTLKRIQVILDLDEQLPVIMGAASELGSAIMNLSVNAVDAMPDGGTLVFRSRALKDGRIELRVEDSGHGMTPEVRAKAMEPFFTTKPVGKGTGLGLSRVYGTLRAHGGSVEIQSQPGKGTAIILRLPTHPGDSLDAVSSDGAVLLGLDKPLRILLVDDDGIILETIPIVLESMGHTVATAPLGEDALRRLEIDRHFDLVILDHNMPGLTGVETLIRLRSQRPELPVVLSTGFMDIKTQDSLVGIPHVWILKKPYNMREIQRVFSEISKARL